MKTNRNAIAILAVASIVTLGACQSKQKSQPASAAEQTEQAESAAQKMYDFTMPDPDGQMLTMSNIVGANRYTLIDFWASWCGPCRVELPNVQSAYERFHPQGLEVVGVSLDNDRDAWTGCIESMQLAWPNVSDLKGWESAAARLYRIDAIPSNVLVDSTGTIVATDLRGAALHSKLAELFN